MFPNTPFQFTFFVEKIVTDPQPELEHDRRKAAINAEIPPHELEALIKYLQSRLDNPGPNGKAHVRLIGRMFA